MSKKAPYCHITPNSFEELTDAERRIVEDFRNTRSELARPMRSDIEKDEETDTLRVVHKIKSEEAKDYSYISYCKAFGAGDERLAAFLHTSLQNAMPPGNIEANTNEGMALIHGIGPQDQVEGLLAIQMAATHLAVMKIISKLQTCEYLEHSNSYANQSNKFLRTFMAQTEALKKYRAKANQTVRVDHVHVNEGGQAIVGDVHHQGGGNKDSKDQCHAKPVTHAPEPPMRCENPEGNAVPFPGDQGKEKVPNARG